jgi:hypothetical protein
VRRDPRTPRPDSFISSEMSASAMRSAGAHRPAHP